MLKNLKDLSLSIPKGKLVVLTGPSGSGKSSLAMDTLFRECQRQYLESMGLQGINKPKVDSISGLSPAISVNQHMTNRNPRSTVGTVTDMYTSLRMIFEKLGKRHCPACAEDILPTFNQAEIEKEDNSFREYIRCPHCQHRLEKLTRTHFSYNTLEGACPTCKGLGEVVQIHQASVFHQDLSIENGAVDFWKGRYAEYQVSVVRAAMEYYGVPLEDELPYCYGQRLNEVSRKVSVAKMSIPELVNHSLEDMLEWVEQVERTLDEESKLIVDTFIQDLKTKLTRITKIGLGYLTLDRQTISLSGGEAQRIRLASLLDSALTGVLYILDEPTAGLHPKDTIGLVKVMKDLRDLGNTVLVIEHDLDVMREADYIIDMGPGAGKLGGKVVGEGMLTELIHQEQSVTGRYLRNDHHLEVKQYRQGIGQTITVHQASVHNLQRVTVSFPIGCLVAVTGVSGSGKSTLVFDVLGKGNDKILEGVEQVTGLDYFEQMVTVGQAPLSRMKRSNVATYTDAYADIRNLFARLQEAKEKGLTAKHFSFNTEGGRCENCQGLGYVTTNMLFFPDLEVTCPVCHGQRFKQEVLTVKYNGHTINDVLEGSVQDCLALFKDENKIKATLDLLVDIGLGYLKLGQSLTTLSGGEGQRLKLAKELMKTSTKSTLYLLDEPTTGLHPQDVAQLANLLHRLVDAGNTVIIVEHNSELINQADWIIDLGPEGGKRGGQVVAEGTPAAIRNHPESYTGKYL